MKVDRRRALALLGLGAAGGCATAPGEAVEGAAASFAHGVASGDPAETSILLWTRVTADRDLDVAWTVAEDDAFTRVVAQGRTRAEAARDHTVKVVAEGLTAGRDYWYRFIASDVTSPVGRARTLPAPDFGGELVLAVASCSLFPQGLFNAYDAIARMDRLDAVVHLGDYIYEYGGGETDYGMGQGRGNGRAPLPAHEILSLADYRQRHAQYKSDADLQAAHARAPWIVVFDDHESANDAFDGGAENHQPDEGDWAARKAAALKAYFEWMPIRDPAPGVDLARATQRGFRFGRVASLHMLDTRLSARTKQLDYATDFYVVGADGQPAPDRDAFMAKLNDPARSLIGPQGLSWIEADARAAVQAGAAWQLIGNQVVMARVTGPDLQKMVPAPMLEAGIAGLDPSAQAGVRAMLSLFSQNVPYNLDSWDGYPAERERLYQALQRAGARPVVLAGDSHTSWVNRLKTADGRDVGVEFGATAVTSPSPAAALGLPIPLANQAVAANEEVEFVDFGPRGFIVLTLTPERCRGEIKAVSTIEAKPYRLTNAAVYQVQALPDGAMGPLTSV